MKMAEKNEDAVSFALSLISSVVCLRVSSYEWLSHTRAANLLLGVCHCVSDFFKILVSNSLPVPSNSFSVMAFSSSIRCLKDAGFSNNLDFQCFD